MAATLGVSRLTYINIESGEKKATFDQLEAISSVLGTRTQELLFPSTMEHQIQSSTAKYRQMCLACIQYGGSSTDGRITKTKLAKLLYLVDFSWFAATGQPMSGLSYRALPRGPVADHFFQMTDDMFESGQIEITPRGAALLFSVAEHSSYQRNLSDLEMAHIKTVASKWQNVDTQTIVEFTHNQSPWRSTQPGMKISYELASQIPPDKLY